MRCSSCRWAAAASSKNISPNLVAAVRYAKAIGAKVIGIVGRDGGYTAQVADAASSFRP